MDEAIRSHSSLSYLHRPFNSPTTSPTSSLTQLKTKEIELDRIITDAKRQTDKSNSIDKISKELQVGGTKTLGVNNDNKLEAINRCKDNITAELGTTAKATLGASNLSSLPEVGTRPARANKLFDYRPVKGPTASRNLPPLLTPGANLVPDLLKDSDLP